MKWNLIKSKNPELIVLAKDWYSKNELELYRKLDSEINTE